MSNTDHVGDLSGAELSTSSLTAPHQVFVMKTSSLTNGTSIEDQSWPYSWRHLVQDTDRRTIASVEVTQAPDSDRYEFAQLEQGPFAESTEAEIRTALNLREVQDGSYELRLLRIPALYTVALWLKDETYESDLLLPLAPTPTGIEVDHVYTAEEFLGALQDLAARQHSETTADDLAGGPAAGAAS